MSFTDINYMQVMLLFHGENFEQNVQHMCEDKRSHLYWHTVKKPKSAGTWCVQLSNMYKHV
jgi:hypothetical protein